MRYGSSGNNYNYWLYGHQDYVMTNLWAIDVDWNEDGRYDGYNEALYCTDIQIRRGRKANVGSIGSGFQHFDVGECRITLDNYNGEYDPYNASAKQYPNVKPGKYIRVSVQNKWNGTRQYLFTGVISDISVSDYGNSEKQAIFTCKDGWNFLNNKTINIPLQTSITTGAAIAMILTEAGWPTIWGSSVEDGVDTLDYFWVNNKTAAEAINELVDSEFGSAVIDGSGQFNFTGRGVRPATSLALTQSDILKQIKVPNPWSVTRNKAEIVVYPRKLLENVPFYTMGDKPLIQPGDSVEIWGDITWDGEAAAVSVIDSVGYTANLLESGTGTDLTSLFTVGNEAYGERIKLTVTNGSPTTAGYVVACIATGDLVVCENKSSVYADDSEGIEAKTFKLDTPWRSSIMASENYANFLLNYLADDTPFPIIKIMGHDDYQFGIDLFDVISLDIDSLSLDAENFRIAYIEHNWKSDSGQLVETTIYTEKNLPAGTENVELMSNGGFEQGDLTNWTTSGTIFSVVDTSAYDGTYCLKISNTTGSGTLTSDRVVCDDNQTYHFSCYTKELVLANDDTSVDCAVTMLSTVRSDNPTSNYHDVNIVGGKTTAAYRALFKVDLGTGNIPSGVEIKAATLKLPLSSVDSQLNTNVSVFRILSTWADTSVTWNTKPSNELQAIGSLRLGKNEATGTKSISIAQNYIAEMIASGSWTNNGLGVMASPEGGLVTTTRTVYYWETYISSYYTKRIWDDVDEQYYYIKVPVYSQRLQSYQVTDTDVYTNLYTFTDALYLTVTYDQTLLPNPDYVIQVKWYDGAVTGTLVRTDTLASDNQGMDWNLRDMQRNSPDDAASFEIYISVSPSDTSFFIDKFSVKEIGFY